MKDSAVTTDAELSENDPIPGSVFNPRQTRRLKILVIVMSVLLVIGFALLLIGIYYQASKMGKSGAARDGRSVARSAGEGAVKQLPAQIRLEVPAGTKITQMIADSGAVVLHLSGPAGEEVIIFDRAHGGALTRLKLTPK